MQCSTISKNEFFNLKTFFSHIGTEMIIIPQSNGYKGHHTGAM